MSNIATTANDTMDNFSQTMNQLNNNMSETSSESNKSSFALFWANYKIHHIIFKSNAYSAVVNGTVTEELKKDAHHCAFGSWYYSQGMKVFGKNATFLAMQAPHEKIHNLINENLDCALNGGCMTANKSKDAIIRRFKEVEEESANLFNLIDKFVEEVGSNIEMKNILE